MSKELEKNYNPQAIEDKLYSKWMAKGYFKDENGKWKKSE